MPIRNAMLAVPALFLGALVFAGDAPAPVLSVEAIGLRVARPNPLKERLIWPAGTTVSVLVSSPIGELIRFDPADSTIAKFVDDKGTDLRARPKEAVEPIPLTPFAHTPKIAADAKTCIVEIAAPGLPARGSGRVLIEGTLSMLCATEKKETVVPNVVLKNGTIIAGANKLELQIAEMNQAPRDLGREAMVFVLRAERELDDVAEIKFFRPDGGEVRAARTSASTLSIQGQVKVDWSYAFPERVDVATVKIYTWTDVQKKRVKLDLTIDLGL